MELEIVEKLCRRFPNHPAMKLGPGDDAAILELAGTSPEIVVSTDLLTEGVDFLLARMNPQKIGRKALAVNLSDLAAMAAEPVGCVISAALPKNAVFPTPEQIRELENEKTERRQPQEPAEDQTKGPCGRLEKSHAGIFLPKSVKPEGCGGGNLMELLCSGFLDATEESAQAARVKENGWCGTLPIAIAGGDTNTWDGPLVLSVTVIGRVKDKPLCRNQAKAGDAIFVTGALGGSILRKQFEFMPRICEMLTLNRAFELHAGMDISDGLTLDLQRLCRQSRCGAELFLEEIPLAEEALSFSERLETGAEIYDWIPGEMKKKSALEHALGDGEDFEILFTAPWEMSVQILENPFRIPVFRIGRILEEEVLLGKSGGKSEILPVSGFVH